jgi:phosphate transport system permease protein
MEDTVKITGTVSVNKSDAALTKKTSRAVRKNATETIMKIVLFICGITGVASVILITLYMILSGAPAIAKIGIIDFLFGDTWYAKKGEFGILPMILTSITGTAGAIIIGVPLGLLTAVFLAETAPKPLRNTVKPAIELLAGIPSVIYGLLGAVLVKPVFYYLEELIYKDDPTHKFTGGANLASAMVVLSIMILPTIINISETSIKAVPQEYREASYGLGATHIQTIFKVVIPAAKSGIASGVVLGVGRAIGEAMAIMLVAGNSANMPALFNSVKFLTTGVVAEFSYSSGLHRQALFGIGLVLFVFIIIINIILNVILKSGRKEIAR